MDMPTPDRRAYVRLLIEQIERENAAVDKRRAG